MGQERYERAVGALARRSRSRRIAFPFALLVLRWQDIADNARERHGGLAQGQLWQSSHAGGPLHRVALQELPEEVFDMPHVSEMRNLAGASLGSGSVCEGSSKVPTRFESRSRAQPDPELSF